MVACTIPQRSSVRTAVFFWVRRRAVDAEGHAEIILDYADAAARGQLSRDNLS
jgi:hypothetical protein